MANAGNGSTLRFTCKECGTHLGVDDSLAGMEAPCPKCGEILVAPDPRSRESRLPGSGVVRGVSRGRGGQMAAREMTARERDQPQERSSDGSEDGQRKSRQILVSTGSSQSEKDSMRVLMKILITTVLVILLVVLVAWFLKN